VSPIPAVGPPIRRPRSNERREPSPPTPTPTPARRHHHPAARGVENPATTSKRAPETGHSAQPPLLSLPFPSSLRLFAPSLAQRIPSSATTAAAASPASELARDGKTDPPCLPASPPRSGSRRSVLGGGPIRGRFRVSFCSHGAVA
jgi:hypothetical protein